MLADSEKLKFVTRTLEKLHETEKELAGQKEYVVFATETKVKLRTKSSMNKRIQFVFKKWCILYIKDTYVPTAVSTIACKKKR